MPRVPAAAVVALPALLALSGCIASPLAPLPALALPGQPWLRDWTPAGSEFAFDLDPDARTLRADGVLRIRNDLGEPRPWVLLAMEPYEILSMRDEAGRDLPHRVENASLPVPFRGVPWPPLPEEAAAPAVSLQVVNVTLDGDAGPGAQRALHMAFEGWGGRDRALLGGGGPNEFGAFHLALQPVTLSTAVNGVAAPSNFTLSYPASWIVLATAEPTGRAERDGRVDDRYTTTFPGSWAVAAQGLEWLEERVDGIEVRTYFYPDMRAQGRAVHDVTRATLTLLPALTGPYPFGHLWTVPNQVMNNAFSRPGLTFLGLNFYRATLDGVPVSISRAAFPAPWPGGETSYENVVVHEHTHNWWWSNVRGNGTVPGAGPLEGWITEGITTYLSEFVWAEVQHGAEEAALVARDRGHAVLRARLENGQERVVTEPGGDAYSKPALALRALQGYAIQQGKGGAVLEALRLAQERFGRLQGGPGVASTSQMMAVFEEIFGEPLEWHFDPWLMGRDLSNFQIASVAADGAAANITVANVGAVPAAVQLKATTLTGRELWAWGFVPGSAQASVLVALPGGAADPVVRVEADPLQYVYEADDTDNVWTVASAGATARDPGAAQSAAR